MFTWFAWGFDSAHWKSWLWQVFVNSRKRFRKSPTLRPMPRVGGSTNKPLRWVQRSPWISLSNIQRPTWPYVARCWKEDLQTLRWELSDGLRRLCTSAELFVQRWLLGPACACPSWILSALWLPAVVHRGLIIIFDDTDLLISSAHFSADLYNLHFLAKLPQPAAWGGAGGPPWTYHQRYRKIIWLIRNYPNPPRITRLFGLCVLFLFFLLLFLSKGFFQTWACKVDASIHVDSGLKQKKFILKDRWHLEA